MIEYIRARLGERSTHFGIGAVGLAALLLVSAFILPPESFGNVKEAVIWIGEFLFVSGVAGVLWKEKDDDTP